MEATCSGWGMRDRAHRSAAVLEPSGPRGPYPTGRIMWPDPMHGHQCCMAQSGRQATAACQVRPYALARVPCTGLNLCARLGKSVEGGLHRSPEICDWERREGAAVASVAVAGRTASITTVPLLHAQISTLVGSPFSRIYCMPPATFGAGGKVRVYARKYGTEITPF